MAEAGGTPVEWSLCATTVRTGEPYVVPDATLDVVQRTNPLVTQDAVRSYAGAPLVTSGGQVLGAYCVLSDQDRAFTEQDVQALTAMADALVAELEGRRRRS